MRSRVVNPMEEKRREANRQSARTYYHKNRVRVRRRFHVSTAYMSVSFWFSF